MSRDGECKPPRSSLATLEVEVVDWVRAHGALDLASIVGTNGSVTEREIEVRSYLRNSSQ